VPSQMVLRVDFVLRADPRAPLGAAVIMLRPVPQGKHWLNRNVRKRQLCGSTELQLRGRSQ